MFEDDRSFTFTKAKNLYIEKDVLLFLSDLNLKKGILIQ